MKTRQAKRVTITIGLSASMACGGADSEVASQREKWRELHPEQYVIQTCGTGFMAPDCSVQAVEGDSAPGPVEGMFDAVDDASDCDVTTLSFDPTYGFISEYYLDCGEEGSGAIVRCFRPDTLDTSTCGPVR